MAVWIWVLSLLFALLTGWIARRRGANPVFWGALGFFLGPLALPFVLLGRPRRPPGKGAGPDGRRGEE